MRAQVGGTPHGIAGLDVEDIEEWLEILQRANGAETSGRMRIDCQASAPPPRECWSRQTCATTESDLVFSPGVLIFLGRFDPSRLEPGKG
jgi:hypothetical protein